MSLNSMAKYYRSRLKVSHHYITKFITIIACIIYFLSQEDTAAPCVFVSAIPLTQIGDQDFKQSTAGP